MFKTNLRSSVVQNSFAPNTSCTARDGRIAYTRGGSPTCYNTQNRQVHINLGVSSNQHINKLSLSGSSHHPNGSKHAAAAAAEWFPEQMAGGSRPLPRAANGRLVCLFMINSVLRALITCATLPSGSGAAFARQAGKQWSRYYEINWSNNGEYEMMELNEHLRQGGRSGVEPWSGPDTSLKTKQRPNSKIKQLLVFKKNKELKN